MKEHENEHVELLYMYVENCANYTISLPPICHMVYLKYKHSVFENVHTN